MEILRRIVAPSIVILFFFIVLFTYIKLAGPIPFDITSITTQKSDAFSVTGEGKVEAKPDSATVRLGVVARASTSEQARTALNTNINKVIGAVKDIGVDEKDIKTENFNIYPEYGQPIPLVAPADQNRISGYTANTNISVTVATAELANQIIDIGVANGANQVGGVDFQVKDKNAALNTARELAVADAKKKAEDAARITGFKLGKIINYSEGEGGGYPRLMTSGAVMDKEGGIPTQIEPGTNEIMVTVTLSYEIR